MPPIIPPRQEQAMQALAYGANQGRATVSQQQQNIATPAGLVAYSTGILFQQGTSTNYTTGYGWEIPSDGAGSIPVWRYGVITWTSPAGTVTIIGAAYFDSAGNLRRAIGPRVRTDTATVTKGSDTVLDASIGSGDNGKPVFGTGIPSATYVGTVTAGTSFLLSSSPSSQVNVNATANAASVEIELSTGDQVFDTSGNFDGYVGYFNASGTWQGNLNF